MHRRIVCALALVLSSFVFAAAAHAGSYHDEVMADSPMAYFRLDEAGGTTAHDEIASGGDARYYNHPYYASEGGTPNDASVTTTGYSGVSWASGPPEGSPLTVESLFRVKPGPTYYDSIITKNQAYGIYVLWGQLWTVCWSQSGQWIDSHVNVDDGQWHHTALVLDQGMQTLYVDGTAVGSAACPAVSWASDITFGAEQPHVRDMDEVAIYDHALSADRIAAHAAARTQPDPTAPGVPAKPAVTGGAYSNAVLADKPWGFWRMEESPWSDTLTDSSGNGHDGGEIGGGGGAGLGLPSGAITTEGSNHAWEMNGQSFEIYPPANTMLDFTLETWVRDVFPVQYGYMPEAAWVSTNGGGPQWIPGLRMSFICCWSGRQVFEDGTTFRHVVGAPPGILDNTDWHQVVVTRDTATDEVKTYFDGQLMDTVWDGSDSVALDPMTWIGDMSYYKGGLCMDDVSLYDHVLPASRVAAHYAASGVANSTGGCRGVQDSGPPPPPPPPTNTVPPTITGSASVGSTVTCGTGAWTGDPASYAYTWQRSGTDIAGATSSTYVLTNADVGQDVTCTVVATNAGGDSQPAVSSNAISMAATGQVLTCPGPKPKPKRTESYAWTRDGSAIGNTDNTLSVTSGDAGTTLSCATTVTNPAGQQQVFVKSWTIVG